MTLRRSLPHDGQPAHALTRRDRRDEFCTVTEAAELLGVSVSTVWRWIDAGKLPALRVGPKAIRIRRTDVDAAVQPITHREEVTMMNSVYVDVEAAGRAPTREEKQRGLAALADAEKLRAEIRARRGGKHLSGSDSIIRRAREERSRRV